MKINLKQIRALHDQSRHSFWLAGRRGGKTYAIAEDIKQNIPLWLKNSPPESDIVYLGPTNQMSLELIWDKLEYAFWKLHWPCKPYVSKQRFEFPNRRNLYVIGAEKSRRVRGKKLYRAYMDELAYYEADIDKVWFKDIRPALTDLGGGCRAATTPDGKGSPTHKFFKKLMSTQAWTNHHWFSEDNPYLDRKEIELAKMELDEKSYNQEFRASWESYEGLAYYNFDELIHVKKQPEIITALPLILHFDFNVNPTTLLLAQRYPDMYRFIKEYSFKHSSTEKTIEAFCDDFHEMRGSIHLKIRGDASGSARSSNTGYADYFYIHKILRDRGFTFQHEVKASNPAIVDRLKHANAYLKNSLGQHRVEFDPSMTDTITDFSGQGLNGRHPSDKGNLGHKADAATYGIYWDWMITRDGTRSDTISL